MDEEFIVEPKKWDAGSVSKFMLFIGPISSLFDFATFAVLFFVFKANTVSDQTLFQTGWFVEGLLSQTLIIHMIRTKKYLYSKLGCCTGCCLDEFNYDYWCRFAVYAICRCLKNGSTASDLFSMAYRHFGLLLFTYTVGQNWFIQKFHTWL
jgi:Mg2+-importing ATPase